MSGRTKTKSVIDRRQAQNERKRKQRERERADPETYNEKKRLERQRYHERKAQGKIKLAQDLQAKQLARMRRDWRQRTARCRA